MSIRTIINTNLHRKLGSMWIAFGGVLTAGLLLAAPSSASAGTPIKLPFSFTADDLFTDVLPFPVDIYSVVSGTQTLYFDQNGALTRIYIHNTEQDTFTANGKTLVGLPYTFNAELIFDSNGNLIHQYSEGNVENMLLPVHRTNVKRLLSTHFYEVSCSFGFELTRFFFGFRAFIFCGGINAFPI